MKAERASPKDSPRPADPAALARGALARGQAAMATGDLDLAARWLDRACRLAPTDRTLTLTLAAACLPRDPARAAALFARVTETDDVREVWIGLAAARLRCDDTTGALDAVARALQRHAPDASLMAAAGSVADAVVAAAGAIGWCGLLGSGELFLRSNAAGDIAVSLDGRDCPGATLPRGWQSARQLRVRLGERDMVGSPIDIAAIRRSLGFVEAHAGGLRGWAWHPGDPDLAPALSISQAIGRGSTLRFVATRPADGLQGGGALARARAFSVPAEALARMSGLLHVRGADGRDLMGSPLDPSRERRATAAAAAALARAYPARSSRRLSHDTAPPPAMPADVVGIRPGGTAKPRPLAAPPDVVVPVYGNAPAVSACLDTLLATVAPPSRIIMVDDASPDPDMAAVLAQAAATGQVTVMRLAANLGFPGAANAGIAASSAGRDVVLLNSDTLVPPGWLERLRAAAWSAPDIGTVTPLSNNASVLSYPDAADRNPVPNRVETIRLDAEARAANAATVVDIPVGVGFCLYIRRDCLAEVGVLRADVFAQGYGEENDFCLRARHLGWRHVALPGLFVGHSGGASFGPAGRHLQQRNEQLLERLHPGYNALVQAFLARDPLALARRRLDLQRWRSARKRGGHAAILVSHHQGGGVERQLAAAAAAHRAAGRRPIVLRPSTLPDGTTAVMLSDGPTAGFPNLRFRLPEELPDLLRLLRAERAQTMEIHHLLGHSPAIHALIAALRLPCTVHVHDYAWFCPRISLVGADRRYCGEPDVAGCEACIADAGALIEEDIGVQALRDRSARLLAAAQKVVAPSEDAAIRMRRHFPALRPRIEPHEDDAALADPPAPMVRDGIARICVLGAIGLHKGYDVLLACARDSAQRRLPLAFVVVGHTIDDARLLATDRVFITGEYRPDEAVALIAAQQATLGFLPSIWPETWSLGLTELWRAGLRVAAFAFGAPAERIRATGRGVLLPIGLPAAGINNALVAACGLSVHEGA